MRTLTVARGGSGIGAVRSTNLAGIDPRIKAAVPSCGGSGDLVESEAIVPGGSRTGRSTMELACVSDNAYIPLITCPVLWLSPTNDFNAPIDNMAWNWRNLPDDRLRFSISPHFNHRHTDEHALTEYLWFEQHLKGAAFKMPATPRIVLELKTADGVPRVIVTPDHSQPVLRVDLYYSLDPHALTRFWRDAKAVKVDRVVMFSGPRDQFDVWQKLPSATPGNRYFGFSHVLDDGWTGDHYPRSWQLLDLQKYGPVVDVDHAAPPYGNTRRLTTAADVKGDAKRAHSGVVPGGSAVKDASGNYIHEAVWRYLFTHPVEETGKPVPADPHVWMDQRKERP